MDETNDKQIKELEDLEAGLGKLLNDGWVAGDPRISTNFNTWIINKDEAKSIVEVQNLLRDIIGTYWADRSNGI